MASGANLDRYPAVGESRPAPEPLRPQAWQLGQEAIDDNRTTPTAWGILRILRAWFPIVVGSLIRNNTRVVQSPIPAAAGPLAAVGIARGNTRLVRIEARFDERLDVARVSELKAPSRQAPFQLATLEPKLLRRRHGMGETKLKLLGRDKPPQAEYFGCEVQTCSQAPYPKLP